MSMDATKEMKGQTGVSPVASSGASHHGGWVKQLRSKLDKYTSFPRNWNGCDGLPVSQAVADFSVQLLNQLYRADIPCPSIVPGEDGSMQIEWHCGDYDVELDVLAANKVDAWRENEATGREDEILVTNDFTVIIGWMDDLARNLQAKKDG